jgi:hypothetical protein
VVATDEAFIGSTLIVRRVQPPIPRTIAAAIKKLSGEWKVGEDEIDTATGMAAVVRQVHDGFYYRWAWPGGVKDHEWLEARSAWYTEVREKLSRSTPGMDSEGLLARAAERYECWEAAGRPQPRPERVWDSVTWVAWKTVKDRPEPPKETVWLDRGILDWVLCRARELAKEAPCAIWYDWQAVGDYFRERGVRVYGAGDDASVATADLIACSMAQAEGKNLQRYARAIIVDLPGNGGLFEQLVSRHHREGQLHDEVVVEWLGHSQGLREAMEQIIDDSEYVEKTTGTKRRILYAMKLT